MLATTGDTPGHFAAGRERFLPELERGSAGAPAAVGVRFAVEECTGSRRAGCTLAWCCEPGSAAFPPPGALSRRPDGADVSELSAGRCQACTPGTPGLQVDRALELHAQVDPRWILHGDRIVREFQFKNFRDAFGMATRVALVAEEQGHHPDFAISWGKLILTLTTHAAKGLTDNDFIMAAKIDELA